MGSVQPSLNDRLDILGQQPGLQIYTQICLIFPVQDAAAQKRVAKTLTHGLERLSESFPWVAGQVINHDVEEGGSGIFSIVPLDKPPLLVVKELDNGLTMEALRRAGFPMSMLDEKMICPANTIPGTRDETPLDRSRVFSVQASFIPGGLILSFLGHHQTMDMVGQAQVMHLLSTACGGSPFTPEELSTGNRPRHDMIPLLDDSYKPGPELAMQLPPPAKAEPESAAAESAPNAESSSPTCSWTTISFSSASLAALKAQAVQDMTLPTGQYLSTDDALTALLWQSILRARSPRLDPTASVSFGRAVDARRYLNAPSTYPGLLQNMAYNTFPLTSLLDLPLGAIASALRTQVDPATSDVAFRTRALATHLSRSKDKGIANFTAGLNLEADLMFSSWAKLDCYELDFALGLGQPESVMRPLFVPVESLGYLLPKSSDGAIVIVVCLREEDLVRLRADGEFTKFGRFVG